MADEVSLADTLENPEFLKKPISEILPILRSNSAFGKLDPKTQSDYVNKARTKFRVGQPQGEVQAPKSSGPGYVETLAKDIIGGAASQGYQVITNPLSYFFHDLPKSVWEQSAEQYRKAQEATSPVEKAGRYAAMTPFVGPMAASIGEDVGTTAAHRKAQQEKERGQLTESEVPPSMGQQAAARATELFAPMGAKYAPVELREAVKGANPFSGVPVKIHGMEFPRAPVAGVTGLGAALAARYPFGETGAQIAGLAGALYPSIEGAISGFRKGRAMRAAGETGPSFWKYGDQTPPPKPPEPPPAPTGETLYGRPVAGPYSKYTPGQSPKYVSPTDYMGSVLREENTPAGFEQWLKEQGYNEDNRDILQGKLQEKLRKAEEAKAAEAQKVKKENVDLKERPFTPVKPGPVKPPGAKPPDVKPDEVKPEPEVKPVEVKPVEVKPEEKPVEPEVKPVEPETKPVETETVKHPDDTLYNNVIKKAAENGYVSNELIQKWSKNWADKPAGWGRAKRIMERLESEKLLGDRHPNRGQKFLGEKAPGEKITSSELADSAEEDPATTVAREIARGLSSKEFPREDVGGGQNLLKMYAQDAHRRLIGGDIPDDVYESVKGKVAELKTKKLAEERDIAKRREDLPFGSEELPGRPFTKKELAEEVEKRDERTKTTEAEISSKKKNVLLSTLQSVGVPNADIERMRSDWTIEQVMEFNNKLLSSGENWGEVLKGAFGGKKPVETKTEGPGKVEPPVKDPEIRVLQNRSRGLIKELKMSDADRKALMKEKFGVESSTKLSTAQLQELVNHLVKLKAGK